METSLFLEFFGDTPFFRVLDFLIENRGIDYSKTEIAKGAEIGWTTLYKTWDRLEKAKLVKQTRAYGNTKLYKLNLENPVVQQLLKLEMLLIKLYAPQREKQTMTLKHK